MKRLSWFVVSGSIGFAADAAMLALLLTITSMSPFSARIVAILFALAFTWIFNRSVTFGKSGFPVLLEGARYGSVGLISAALNYAIYAGTLAVIPSLSPFLALAAACLAAMLFSWTGYSRYVFQK